VDPQRQLRLSHARRLRLRESPDPNLVTFIAGGKEWQAAKGLIRALDLLHAVLPRTLRELENAVDERTRPLIGPFVAALLVGNVVWSEEAAQFAAFPTKREPHDRKA
jgi:hypothetical protein